MKLRRALFRGQGSPFRGKSNSNIGPHIGPRQRKKSRLKCGLAESGGVYNAKSGRKEGRNKVGWKIFPICFLPRKLLGKPEAHFSTKVFKNLWKRTQRQA